jgi:RND family efflux transporter MFP subunit
MLEKQVELFNQNLGSEFDKRSAENQVTSIESKLKTLAIQKSKMTVIAPFDGKVDQVFAKKGQLASPQMPLMRLVNTENTEVVASVSEKHFKNIKKGTEIKVNFPNYNIEPVITKASTIGSYIDPTNRTFTVRAKIANNAGLMPNMLTELEITDFKIESGLVVPSASILKNAKSQDYIWVLTQDKKDTYKAQQVFIDKIMAYQGQALIEDHDQISEGSIIIEGGARGIAKKDIVRIK